MIVTQTPLRISFFGGGTDFPGFYRNHGGAVLSTAIDKYVFVIVKERFDDDIYINYSRKEIVDSVDEVQHDLVREAMHATGVTSGVEITTLADVPSTGTGLGSSSAVLVGLLHALHTHQGDLVTAKQLAEEACAIEIDRLGRPIGEQDQYIAAFGGMRLIEFGRDGAVNPQRLHLAHGTRQRLATRLMLFYTNRGRSADTILGDQRDNIPYRIDVLDAMRDMAYGGVEHLVAEDFDALGRDLDAAWQLKTQLAKHISDAEIDGHYSQAKAAGALGGKITGAGGGGFMLIYAPPSQQDRVRDALASLRELPVGFEADGSKVIFNIRG